MRDHVRGLEQPEDRVYQRYLLLTNLNNNSSITVDEMRSHRAAASKLLNSLSWKREIRLPVALDPATQSVFQFDIRWYGWTAETWEQILTLYPYGVVHGEDRKVREVEKEIASLTGTRMAYVRADWFVANVSQPPLYEKVLKIPKTLAELEKDLLFIDSERAFREDDLLRAGMLKSNVSLHNRMVERLETRYGAYWRSYDFGTSDLRTQHHPLPPWAEILGK